MNNPIFIVLAIVIVFFYVEGSLDKYHILLMLYLSVVSHFFIGNMFADPTPVAERTSKVPLIKYFQALPLSGHTIYASYLFSAVVYITVIYILVGLLLTDFMKLPDLASIEFIESVTPDGDTVTTVTGIAFSRRFVPRFVSFVLEKSILFDPLSKMGNGPLLLMLYFVLIFVYISVYQVYKEFHLKRFDWVMMLYKIPLSVFLFLGFAFTMELILSQREMGIWLRSVVRHYNVALSLFVVIVFISCVCVVSMSKTILKKLRIL